MTKTYQPFQVLNNGILSLSSLSIVIVVHPCPTKKYDHETNHKTEQYPKPDTLEQYTQHQANYDCENKSHFSPARTWFFCLAHKFVVMNFNYQFSIFNYQFFI